MTKRQQSIAAGVPGGSGCLRKQLETDWATYPASDKARCVQPKEYTPGYVEWLTCLEMDRDVRAMRKGQPAATSSDVHQCPAVQFPEDATITSVNNIC